MKNNIEKNPEGLDVVKFDIQFSKKSLTSSKRFNYPIYARFDNTKKADLVFFYRLANLIFDDFPIKRNIIPNAHNIII